MTDENEAVILSAARTPIGKFQGSLSGVAATKLGAIAIQAAVDRAGIDPKDIEEVIMGNVVQAGEGQAPARQSGIYSGIPATVSATTVNKVCGSGLKAAMMSAQAVRAGDADLFVAGGFESMSRAPYLVNGRMGELKFGNVQMTDALLNDGLFDPFENWGMGNAAEFIGEELPGVTFPSGLNAGLSFDRASSDVSLRGPSSVSTTKTSPLRPAIWTGTISGLNFPAS